MPKEIDDIRDALLDDNDEDLELDDNDEDLELDDDKPEEKVVAKKEDKPAKELKKMPPVTDDNKEEVAFAALDIYSDMKEEMMAEFKGLLDPKELKEAMAIIRSYGVKQAATLYNTNFHIKCGDVAVAAKRRQGLLTDKKVNRDKTEVGGGQAKRGPTTVGKDIMSRFGNDPKLKEFFDKKKGAKV